MFLQPFHKLRFAAFSLVACMLLTTSYAQEGLDGGTRSADDGNGAQQRVGSVFRDANGGLRVVIPLEVLLKANNSLLQGSARHHAYDGGSDPDPPADEPTEIAGSWRTVNGLSDTARGVGYEDPEGGSPLNSGVVDTLSSESRGHFSSSSMSRDAAAIAARAKGSSSTGRVGTVQIHGGNVNLTPSQRAALQRIIQQRKQTQQQRSGAYQGLGFTFRGGDEEEDPDAQESTQIAGFGRVPNGLDSSARSAVNAGASNKPLGYVIRDASGKLMMVMPLESLRGVDASSALQGNSRDWLSDFINDNRDTSGTHQDGRGKGGGGSRG